jgi:hypothetical protein
MWTDRWADGQRENKSKEILCSGQALHAIENYHFPFYSVNSPIPKVNPNTG